MYIVYIYIYLSLCIIPPDLLRISVADEVSHEKAPEKTSPADATAQPAKAQAAEPSEADGKDQNADGGDKNKSTEATWNSDEYWDVTQGYAAGQNQLFVLSLSSGKKEHY